MLCSSCGGRNPSDVSACEFCARPLGSGRSEAAQRDIVWLAYVLAVLVLVGLVLALLRVALLR